jgi:hypothetical protein
LNRYASTAALKTQELRETLELIERSLT